jgi:demethylmenaquinone methyltransferase/2-methoxy-6-polyprenyl-1,4-benzoquinol methylase
MTRGISEQEIGRVPHLPLDDYYRDEQERRSFVRRMFDATAADYDRIERVAAFGTGQRYRRQALVRAGLAPGMTVLDVATGTGLVAREAAAIVGDPGQVIGLDPSAHMLRAVRSPHDVLAIQGEAESLPIATARFDFLSLGFALRHLADLPTVFGEFFRVLQPGGRVLILEVTRPHGALAQACLKGYMRGLVPLLARLIGHCPESARLMRYYWDTIEACIPPEGVIAALRNAGFGDVHCHVELRMFSEYRARKPK